MLVNEIKFAFRRIINEVNYSLINLASLTLGVSFSFLIYLYVSDQLSYDQGITDADYIYRISSDFIINGHQDIYSNAPRPMGDALVTEYPGILAATKVVGYNGLQTHTGYLKTSEDTYIESTNLFAADSNFLRVFDMQLISGDQYSLHAPNSAIISTDFAKKLFNKVDAIGEEINLENKKVVKVTGVFEPSMTPTYMIYDAIISYTTFFNSPQSEIWWYGGHVNTYIKTSSGFKPSDVYNNWDPFYEKYMKATFDELNGNATIIIQPLKNIYLDPEYIWEPYPHSSRQNIRLFSLIGLFLILVAAFNFMNLSLSQSFYRQKASSIQKILGSGKISLIRQHIISSILLSIFSGILSVSLVATLVPVLNQLTPRSLEIDFSQQPEIIAKIFLVSVSCGILASIYPAFYEVKVANHQPFKKILISGGGLIMRKIFVITQLAISIGLIVLTMVVLDQINYVRNRGIGFQKENLVIVDLKDRDIRKNANVFIEHVRALPGVKRVTKMDETPSTGVGEFSLELQTKNGEFVSTPSQTLGVGLDFVSTMEIELLSGRELIPQDDEYYGILISRFLAEKLGYEPGEAVGINFRFRDEEERGRKVIGVFDDFTMGSANEELKSMVLGLRQVSNVFLVVRLNDKNQQATLDQINKLWHQDGAYLPFVYRFMSTELDGLLIKEDTLYRLLIIGSFLIILISCLGLFGLASHNAVHKTKEIGIRKVVGANKVQLFNSMVGSFKIPFTVAFIIGTSLSWYFGNAWLQGFAVRTHFNWVNIPLTAFLAIGILLFTLSYHTFKVINANPVDSLRYE